MDLATFCDILHAMGPYSRPFHLELCCNVYFVATHPSNHWLDSQFCYCVWCYQLVKSNESTVILIIKGKVRLLTLTWIYSHIYFKGGFHVGPAMYLSSYQIRYPLYSWVGWEWCSLLKETTTNSPIWWSNQGPMDHRLTPKPLSYHCLPYYYVYSYSHVTTVIV